METTKQPDYKKVFSEAAEIASVVPESMQPAAFNRALDLLQGTTVTTAATTRPTEHQLAKADVVPADWYERIDRTRYPHIAGSGTVLAKSLAILRLARDDHGVDGLSPADISKVLREKFRFSISAVQVSNKLGVAGNAVDRHKDGRGYVYRLMRAGEAMLESPYTANPSARRKSSVTTKSKNNGDGSKQTQGIRRSNGRPGPIALLNKLLDEGFFAVGRKTADVIEYARKNLGYTYKATDLSPAFIRTVRNGRLKRDLDKGGQYEYTAS